MLFKTTKHKHGSGWEQKLSTEQTTLYLVGCSSIWRNREWKCLLKLSPLSRVSVLLREQGNTSIAAAIPRRACPVSNLTYKIDTGHKLLLVFCTHKNHTLFVLTTAICVPRIVTDEYYEQADMFSEYHGNTREITSGTTSKSGLRKYLRYFTPHFYKSIKNVCAIFL